jgi:hypothetical protein
MDSDERIALLEKKVSEHDKLIAKLVAYARLTPTGRMLLKALGV